MSTFSCTDKCDPSKWGRNCSMSCFCIDGFCHHETGKCSIQSSIDIFGIKKTNDEKIIETTAKSTEITQLRGNSFDINFYNNNNDYTSTELQVGEYTHKW